MSKELILVELERFQELQEAELKLTALENCGVDNWDGYGDAMDYYQELKNE